MILSSSAWFDIGGGSIALFMAAEEAWALEYSAIEEEERESVSPRGIEEAEDPRLNKRSYALPPLLPLRREWEGWCCSPRRLLEREERERESDRARDPARARNPWLFSLPRWTALLLPLADCVGGNDSISAPSEFSRLPKRWLGVGSVINFVDPPLEDRRTKSTSKPFSSSLEDCFLDPSIPLTTGRFFGRPPVETEEGGATLMR